MGRQDPGRGDRTDEACPSNQQRRSIRESHLGSETQRFIYPGHRDSKTPIDSVSLNMSAITRRSTGFFITTPHLILCAPHQPKDLRIQAIIGQIITVQRRSGFLGLQVAATRFRTRRCCTPRGLLGRTLCIISRRHYEAFIVHNPRRTRFKWCTV